MSLSSVRLFAVPWTEAHRAPLVLENSSPRILQDRILEWVAIPFSRGSCRARDALAGELFTTKPLGKPKIQIRQRDD